MAHTFRPTHDRFCEGENAIPPGGRKPVIGLTGGVGAGKSSVSRCLASLGAAIVDTDELAHEVLCDPDVVATLRSWWGDSVIHDDGSVNRRKVADVVFGDSAALTRLEGLLHPRILARCDELVARYKKSEATRAIVIDAPKLYEAGVDKRCDVVLFVDTSDAVRLDRVVRTRGWTEQELKRRDRRLAALDNKRTIADYVVENNSGIDDLRSKVELLFESMLATFK